MFADMPPVSHIAPTGNYSNNNNGDNPNPIVVVIPNGDNESLHDYYREHSERYGSVERLLDNAL